MRQGVLERGDFLVMDNASVHTGTTLGFRLVDLFRQYGVTIVALPTYSPELNPCELVFARMKHFIRSVDALHFDPDSRREMVVPFTQIIEESLARISIDEISRMYERCRHPKYM